METLGEFKSRIKNNINHPKKYKITNSWGIYDGFKYYRKNKPKDKEYILTESQYFAITRAVNKMLADSLASGDDVRLPKSMGLIELRKYEKIIRMGKDGKIHTNLPIDWNATLELWHNDKEAYQKRTLVRNESDELYKIYYNKNKATYQNSSFYEFVFHKDLRNKVRQNIKLGIVDAFLSQKNINYGD